jgi:hypothetical protein
MGDIIGGLIYLGQGGKGNNLVPLKRQPNALQVGNRMKDEIL